MLKKPAAFVFLATVAVGIQPAMASGLTGNQIIATFSGIVLDGSIANDPVAGTANRGVAAKAPIKRKARANRRLAAKRCIGSLLWWFATTFRRHPSVRQCGHNA